MGKEAHGCFFERLMGVRRHDLTGCTELSSHQMRVERLMSAIDEDGWDETDNARGEG